MNPTFDYEKKLWQKGLRFVAGADEVGRGAFAGPVVAAAVVFDPLNINIPKKILVKDSKKMTKKQRTKAALWLKENTYWGIGEVSVSTINKVGIGKAAKSAFRKAISEVNYHLPKRLEHLLVDAFFVPHTRGLRKEKQTAIIKGDNISTSIAAASIIAKHYRDELMESLSNQPRFEKYNWAKNAGYGTSKHRNALLEFGACRHHRRQFIKQLLFASPE